jgi:hypothetical protein
VLGQLDLARPVLMQLALERPVLVGEQPVLLLMVPFEALYFLDWVLLKPIWAQLLCL